uniref:Uncharacterized protein n=1 Tax=Fundulus heteroclitus TaxID=8078 RepID=A0A3Q2QPW9_FUNHE
MTIKMILLKFFTLTGGSTSTFSYDLSGPALTALYNKRVYLAEVLRRPLGNLPVAVGKISHCGVRSVKLKPGSGLILSVVEITAKNMRRHGPSSTSCCHHLLGLCGDSHMLLF